MSEHREHLPEENKDELPEHETRDSGMDTGGGGAGRLVDEATAPAVEGDDLPRSDDGEPQIDPQRHPQPPVTRSG